MNRTGVLLINIGTPDAPTPEAVGRYLREFLMDGYVLDMPFLKRWLLVNRIIVPSRKEYSAKHYQEIHTEEGSPLLVHTQKFAEALSGELSNQSDEYVVEIGMRYGNPSIPAALTKLKSSKVNRIVALPLYPQYTQSSFQTAVAETNKRARQAGLANQLSFVEPFYVDSGFVTASAKRIEEYVGERTLDHILFSYHSVPVRHIKQIDAGRGHCLADDNCCEAVGANNQNCYRAQCFATTRAIARELGLDQDRYTTCFQSQFGKDKWIGPDLENLLRELPSRGVQTVAVFCPSFVADCLETLEEIGIRGAEEFKEAGGKELILVPCLNSDQLWVNAAANLILESLGRGNRARAAVANERAAF